VTVSLTLVGLAIAFLGGILSFASPCCLPLVPAYLAYMVGTTGERPDRRRSFFHGLAFVAGFTVVFVAFWASIGAVGYVLADNAKLLRQMGGALLIFLGLQTAGVINVRALWRDTRPLAALGTANLAAGTATWGGGSAGGSGAGMATDTTTGHVKAPGYGRSALFGTLFAAGWSPCIGPILGGIIGLASVTASVAEGTVLLLAYAAGLAVPFLAVALGAGWVSAHLGWVTRHHRPVSIVTGGMLIVIGLLMITNMLSRLATLSSPLGL
jgi:cytochrome c-type biogenesis protein